MKRIVLLTLILLVASIGLVQSEAVFKGKTGVLRAVDSLTALDTVATTVRTDVDTSDVIDVKDLEKISFVFEVLADTNFVNDSVGFVWLYSIKNTTDANYWKLLDTVGVAVASDTTYQSDYYGLDTLPPMNYIKFVFYHRDALESSANNVGIFENTYNFDGTVWIKGLK